MRKFQADSIFNTNKKTFEKKIIICDEKGKVLAIEDASDEYSLGIEKYAGILVPGFVNTHCHLELSHMKSRINTGTGLIPFIRQVVQFRGIDKELILEAIEKADQEMFDNGIVAVGDISNTLDTLRCKEKSKIRYYSFVEMFDFLQEKDALKTFEQYLEVYKGHSKNSYNKKSCVPHAPYSVSRKLFELINNQNNNGQTVSIHNQELSAENELFQNKTGDFLNFYNDFGITLEAFRAIEKNSIHYAIQYMNPKQKTIFVHNTQSTKIDIEAALKWNSQSYWASCPNANLYIENKLPQYQLFMDAKAKVTLGTDSLSSNWSLSIWEEVKTIKKYQSYIPLEEILQWATLNGAEALGYSQDLGSFEKGKSPGINLLTRESDIFSIEKAEVRKLL